MIKKYFKLFILTLTVTLYVLEIVTMNKNGNGLISRKIIGKIFNTIGFILKNYLQINEKFYIYLFKKACDLDSEYGCTNYGSSKSDSEERIKYNILAYVVKFAIIRLYK